MSVSAGDQESRPQKPRQSMKMKKLLKQSKAIKKSLNQQQLLAPNTVKNLRADRIKLVELIRVQSYTKSLNTKIRIKQILMNKGRKASQLFWNLVNHKPKKIEAPDSPAGLKTNQDEKNVIIEGFFENKFKTSFNED